MRLRPAHVVPNSAILVVQSKYPATIKVIGSFLQKRRNWNMLLAGLSKNADAEDSLELKSENS